MGRGRIGYSGGKNIMKRDLYYRELDVKDETTSQGVLFHWCRSGVSVLDVGCACGHLGKALHDHKNCRCWGIEYEPRHREIAAELGVYEEIVDTDLNHLTPESFAAWRGKFDTVIAGDVLEHLTGAQTALTKLKECLGAAGELLISLPNIAHASIKAGLLLDQFRYSTWGLLDRTHLHFYTAENVAELLSGAGVEIVEVRGTLIGINGFTDGAAFRLLEPAVLRHIFRDVHSYICQYVCRGVPSRLAPGELLRNNSRKLALSFADFPPELRQYAERTIREFAPESRSSGYTLAFRTFDDLVI